MGFGGVELLLAGRADGRSGHAYPALLRQAATGRAGPGDERGPGENLALFCVPQRGAGAQGIYLAIYISTIWGYRHVKHRMQVHRHM